MGERREGVEGKKVFLRNINKHIFFYITISVSPGQEIKKKIF